MPPDTDSTAKRAGQAGVPAPAGPDAPANPEASAGADASANPEPPAGPASQRPSRISQRALLPDDEELAPGTVIAGCQIEARIGRGGMGQVYRARQLALEKPVALKVLGRRHAERADFVESFLREARLAARLEHENIVQVFDTGTEDGRPYIVMQYVPGRTLRQRLREAPLEIEELFDAWMQVARGLQAAHAKKVIHRDIKPENLILTDGGTIRIADFGLAREDDERAAEESTGTVMASASYMSPEQADLMPVDARSDLYSLGISIYVLATGRHPFTGDSHIEIILRHHLEPAAPASSLRRDLPLTLAAVIDKLIAKHPDGRYASADALLEDLHAIRRRQLPKAAHHWDADPIDPPAVQPRSIIRAGVKKCLEIQRSMKLHGDRLLSLGQLMRANEFVTLAPAPGDARHAADLPFVAPRAALQAVRRGESSAIIVPGDGSPTVSLTEVAAQATGPPAGALNDAARTFSPLYEVAYAPLLLGFDGRYLVLELTTAFADAFAVQHYFDVLLYFPFTETPRVVVRVGAGVSLAVEDVPWLVESHNLLKRLHGHFAVRVADPETYTFFTAHHLEQYLDVAPLGSMPAEAAAPVANAGRVDRARALLAAGDLVRAKQTLMPALAPGVDPDDGVDAVAREIAAALIEAGDHCYAASDYETAKSLYDHAINVSPESPTGYYKKGLTLKKLGQLEYALQYFGQAISFDPNDPNLYYNRAIVRARANDLAGAIDDLTACIERHPRHANAYYNRGIAREKLGDRTLARKDFQLAVKLNPRFQKALGPRLSVASKSSAGANQRTPGGARREPSAPELPPAPPLASRPDLPPAAET